MPGRQLGGGVLGQATAPRPADTPPIDQAGSEAAGIGLGCRVDEASITQYIATTFSGVDVVIASQDMPDRSTAMSSSSRDTISD